MTFLTIELSAFITALDAAVSQPYDIVIIGGAAAALHYGVTQATRDIDTWTNIDAELARAAQSAREATGLEVPLRRSGIADGPYFLEDRLERILPALERLAVFVPERHDLALMKALRADEHDLAAMEELHAQAPMDAQLLLDRFKTEMSHTIIEPMRRRDLFLAMMERLFPERIAQIEADVTTEA